MQLNTLNRVISLFLIGGFVVVLTAVSFRKEIGEFLVQHPFGPVWGPMAGVFLAVGLLSVTALAGAIVDALGNLTVRRFIRKVLARNRFTAGMFLCAGEFKEQGRWKETFEAALQDNPKHKSLAAKEEMIKPLSAGMFFRTAEKEHAEWLIQHHSMYNLSADFVVILIAVAIFAWFRELPGVAYGCLGGAYLLTTFALDNYLYTYQLSFRNAYLAIKDEPEPKEATGLGDAAPDASLKRAPGVAA